MPSASVSLDLMIALPPVPMNVVRLEFRPFHELSEIVRKGVEAIHKIVPAPGVPPTECMRSNCRLHHREPRNVCCKIRGGSAGGAHVAV